MLFDWDVLCFVFSSIMKMEAAVSSETSVPIYELHGVRSQKTNIISVWFDCLDFVCLLSQLVFCLVGLHDFILLVIGFVRFFGLFCFD
jgi:hypothetical protein